MAPEISIVGQIFVKYSTWIITFSLVRIIFQLIGWYDSDAMKMVYFAISTLISFALSYVIMILEKYILWFALGFILVILLFIVIIVKKWICKHKELIFKSKYFLIRIRIVLYKISFNPIN